MKTPITMIFCLIAALFACDDDDNGNLTEAPTFEEVRNCHLNLNLDADGTRDALIGEWDLRSSYNPWLNEISEVEPGTRVITFRSGNVADVETSDATIEDIPWSVQPSTADNYWLDFENNMHIASGWLWVCNDAIIIGNSFVDGLDELYVRLD